MTLRYVMCCAACCLRTLCGRGVAVHLLLWLQDAEEMHLKAISIKERLLGPEDYEVALSVGHLASLYNYDMCKYQEAERLYLRSIAIGKRQR